MQIIDNKIMTFSKENKVNAKVSSGEILMFKTLDCAHSQIKSEDQLLTEIDMDKTNPCAGPVYIEDAEPGDTIMVDILDIDVDDTGFCCAMKLGPMADYTEARTRLFKVENGFTEFNGIKWPIRPMIGVIGTAPEEGAIPCGMAGDHGGNMDCRKIRKGTRVFLPVRHKGALLQMGDVHATMGDGEISGTGIEIAANITVRVSLIKNFKLNWPVIETKKDWYVNVTGEDYDDALIKGCKEISRLMEKAYAWDKTDILIYLSARGNVEINQGMRPASIGMLTLRIGIPKEPGKELVK